MHFNAAALLLAAASVSIASPGSILGPNDPGFNAREATQTSVASTPLVTRDPFNFDNNNTCGKFHSMKKCDTMSLDSGACCSWFGYCGSSQEYCGKGCQPSYGTCGIQKDPKPSKPIKEHRCGHKNGHKTCPNGQCCSHAGYCGLGPDFCSVPQNCQPKFGHCDSDALPHGPFFNQDKRQKTGNVPYGVHLDHCTQPRTIALTYDDGPSHYTPRILKLLLSANATATFFVGGINSGKGQIDQDPLWLSYISGMHELGHQIASHTWSHPNLNAISSNERKLEMWKNERALANIIGKYPTYMRPPYLNCTHESGCLADMKSLAYHIVGYQVDTEDWKHPTNLKAMKNTVDEAFKKASPNGSMLLIQHDTIEASAVELTKHVLKRVQEKGWKAVSVAECLGESLDLAYRYSDNFNTLHGPCAVMDGEACLQVRSFEDRTQCFASLQSCWKQLEGDWKQLEGDWKDLQGPLAYAKASEICEKQLLFCAECGHGGLHKCVTKDFYFTFE